MYHKHGRRCGNFFFSSFLTQPYIFLAVPLANIFARLLRSLSYQSISLSASSIIITSGLCLVLFRSVFYFFSSLLTSQFFLRTFFASIKTFGIYSKNSGHFFWCWWWWSCQWTLYSVQCLCTFQQTPKTQPLPHRHTLTCVFTQTDSSKTVRQLSRVLEMRPLHTSLVLLLKQKNFGFLT